MDTKIFGLTHANYAKNKLLMDFRRVNLFYFRHIKESILVPNSLQELQILCLFHNTNRISFLVSVAALMLHSLFYQ